MQAGVRKQSGTYVLVDANVHVHLLLQPVLKELELACITGWYKSKCLGPEMPCITLEINAKGAIR